MFGASVWFIFLDVRHGRGRAGSVDGELSVLILKVLYYVLGRKLSQMAHSIAVLTPRILPQ